MSVLVIEAGLFDQGQDGILVPGAYDPSPYFWPILSVPQEALDDSVFLGTSARVVGGGSTINAMVFARGDIEDYRSWTKLGNEGWAWDDLLPYFIKVCDPESPKTCPWTRLGGRKEKKLLIQY